MQNVSIGQLWSTAWERFKVHWVGGIGILVVGIILSIIPLIGPIFSLAIGPVLISYGLRALISPQSLPFGQYFPSLGAVFKVIVGNILISLPGAIVYIVGLGSMIMPILSGDGYSEDFDTGIGGTSLFILVLGFILLVGAQILFYTYPLWIIDKSYGIFEGLGAAARLSMNNIGQIVVFLLSAMGINILGAIPCGIGLLVTVPMTVIATAGLYKGLIGEAAPQGKQGA